MRQTNSTLRESETRGALTEPIARFDEFGRITNFYYDEYNILHPWCNPNPRRAYWKKGKKLGLLFHILNILRIIHWRIVSQIWGWRWRVHILMLEKIWKMHLRNLEIHLNAGWCLTFIMNQ